MILMINLTDLIFAIGTLSFLIASFRQVRKIYRTKKTGGVSLTHYRVKMFALSCMLIGYILSNLPLSICVSLADIIINITAIRLITKYRNIGFFSG